MILPKKTIFLCLGLVTVTLYSAPALATLGEPVDSIAKDRKALSTAKRATTSRADYTIHESASDATTVREFVNGDGIVFAVAWNGLVHPDLTPLLGNYAKEYQSAQKKTPRHHGRRQSHVKGDHVVVERWGHPRDLHGRAYVPSLVPAGVSLDEIR